MSNNREMGETTPLVDVLDKWENQQQSTELLNELRELVLISGVPSDWDVGNNLGRANSGLRANFNDPMPYSNRVGNSVFMGRRSSYAKETDSWCLKTKSANPSSGKNSPSGQSNVAFDPVKQRSAARRRKKGPGGTLANITSPHSNLNGSDGTSSQSQSMRHLSLRARTWKALLGVHGENKARYIELVQRGEHSKYGPKIRRDTGRTFCKSASFARRVPESRIIRVLNAFVHDVEGSGFSYVQGLNAVCGVFLYEMPELDAFCCFKALVCDRLPKYYHKNLDGCFEGCQLVKECIQILDPELAEHMRSILKVDCRVYALSPVITLCSCCEPISEVGPIWDILFAGGEYLNIIIYATILVIKRNEILNENGDSSSISQQLSGRDFPKLDSAHISRTFFAFLLKVGQNEKFMRKLIDHTRYVDV